MPAMPTANPPESPAPLAGEVPAVSMAAAEAAYLAAFGVQAPGEGNAVARYVAITAALIAAGKA